MMLVCYRCGLRCSHGAANYSYFGPQCPECLGFLEKPALLRRDTSLRFLVGLAAGVLLAIATLALTHCSSERALTVAGAGGHPQTLPQVGAGGGGVPW